ncbi:MAG: hypothetical protein IIC09_00505 [Proteobacteria bacterium]|nr:hypothetical protein [Pseudomonadota bacterium]
MEQQPTSEQQYKRFISWQCRVRKQCVRELQGRPTAGMSAGVYSISGGEEKSRMNFLMVKQDSHNITSEFRHIIRKSQDPAEWIKNGLRILAERHYQDDFDFSNDLTALFNLDSSLAGALITAGQCRLQFKQDSIEYAFDFKVHELESESPHFQATYWHNHLFNPSIPGQVRVLNFSPLLEGV